MSRDTSPRDDGASARRLIVLSRGVRRIVALSALLPDFQLHFGRPASVGPSDRVLAWGMRPSAARAARYARRNGLAVCHVEDGFLRSVGLGRDEPPLSVVLDEAGLYLDAGQPTQLEFLIAGASATWSPERQARVDRLVNAWRDGRVSKYNHTRDPWKALPRDYVLVVDQTRGDASIRGGNADAASFERMLQAALTEHPDCPVLVKVHPDVVAGRKRGYFSLKRLRRLARVEVVADDVHPAMLLECARAVYAVTSQLGMEALIWGRPVRTFGMPFYAGWGLTGDDLPAPARRTPVTLHQFLHAALIDYSRYVHPETSERCEVEDVLAWLALQRRMRQRFPERLCAVDFSAWKKPLVRQFFAGSTLDFVRDPREAARQPNAIVAWGRRHDASLRGDGVERAVIRVEDGFLRSVGLGASLVRPLSWVQDDLGVYYDATGPSRLERLLCATDFAPPLLARAAALRRRLCEARITKYNLAGARTWRRPALDRRVILVPGQVETDASIRFGASAIRHNVQLLKAVRQAHPDAWLVYKPHPDVAAHLRNEGQGEAAAQDWCDEVIEGVPVPDLLEQVDEVHVLTSLTGFEALLRKVPVVTYGQPFYAGWGLTRDTALSDSVAERRSRILDLDELVAGALILYPTYVSRVTRRFTTPERALQELIEWRSQGADSRLWGKWLAWCFRKP